jgi:Spy/CpxP family protein refolding chaperone
MRRTIAATTLALTLLVGGATAAAADPSFGPGAGQGQGNNDPHENPGTKCHPPGQTSDLPECK